MAAARGNGFVPPVPARGRGRRGSLTPSKGWDFIPNTHGWDEEEERGLQVSLDYIYKL
jgi:hypothetical protein